MTNHLRHQREFACLLAKGDPKEPALAGRRQMSFPCCQTWRIHDLRQPLPHI
jgi:hypothetical protein